MARPVEWTPEKKAEAKSYILEQIALGRSLVSICKEPEMPAYSVVTTWRNDDDEFAANYARAREDQADFHADEIVDIADTETDANLARVRIDARKWKAARMKPKVYGDRLNIDQDLTVRVSPEQRRARIEQLIAKAADAGHLGADRVGAGRAADASRGGGEASEADEVVRPLSRHGSSAA